MLPAYNFDPSLALSLSLFLFFSFCLQHTRFCGLAVLPSPICLPALCVPFIFPFLLPFVKIHFALCAPLSPNPRRLRRYISARLGKPTGAPLCHCSPEFAWAPRPGSPDSAKGEQMQANASKLAVRQLCVCSKFPKTSGLTASG